LVSVDVAGHTGRSARLNENFDESGWPSPHIAAEHEAQGRRIFEQVRRALPEHEVVFRYWERSHRES
jgi:hypothetical protein